MPAPFGLAETHAMSTVTTETVCEEALAQLLRWRFQQLCRAGFEPDEATVLAFNWEIDLHRAIGLVERGCSPALALEILL
jgi:hypothetical protein